MMFAYQISFFIFAILKENEVYLKWQQFQRQRTLLTDLRWKLLQRLVYNYI